jgi:ankyrin repeat protein
MKTSENIKLDNMLLAEIYKIKVDGEKKSNLTTIQDLINRGADMTASGNTILTSPLMIAVQSEMYEVVKLFIENNANLNSASFGMYHGRGFSKTPLYLAAELGLVEMVKLLISSGASLEKSEKSIISPIEIAAENNHQDVVYFFNIKGILLDSTNLEKSYKVSSAGDIDELTDNY